MNSFKKILALSLCLVMGITLTGCLHKKNEIAVTVGDVEFTSAYYMCALINANSEGQQRVNEELDEDESTDEIDYYSKKIDKKSFTQWVEDKAVETLEKIAAYKLLCKENKLELTDEEISEAETYAEYYWSSYGYSNYYEPNGVSQETYTAFMTDNYYSETYFNYVYGKDGTKELSADKVNDEINKNYILADIVTVSYEDEATDEDKAELLTTLEAYGDKIKKGTTTFNSVYEIYNTDAASQDVPTTEDGETEAVYKYATVLGAEDTYYESELYDTVKEYELDVPYASVTSDETGVQLIIKRDILKDAYFLEVLDSAARHSIADEDMEDEIEEYLKKQTTKVSKYATGQFKVKNIIIPESTY